jgi:hypothetical protein
MTHLRLPSDPCDLLRDAGEEPVPEGAFERIAARLGVSALPLPAGGEPVGADGGIGAAGTGVGVVGGGSGSVTAAPARGISGLLSTPAVSIPAAFAVGALVGAGGFAWLRSSEVPAAARAVVSAPARPSAVPTIVLPLVEDAPRSAPAPSASVAAPSLGSPLAQERALLDRARASMTNGEPAAAFEALTRHTRRYPRGLLSEEREAMAVNALVSLGRHAEARARGQAFQQRFPASLMRRSVEAALATAPAP